MTLEGRIPGLIGVICPSIGARVGREALFPVQRACLYISDIFRTRINIKATLPYPSELGLEALNIKGDLR